MAQSTDKGVSLTVNGQELSFPGGCLESLLNHLGVDRKTVVAEVNGVIAPREDFSSIELREGDVVELVRFVGGG